MSDGKFLRGNRLKSVLSRIKTRVGFDIASAISESTLSLTSIINSGDSTTLGSAKGYADGLKIVIDSNISTGDTNTLNSAKSYTDTKTQNKFELEDLTNSPVDVGDIIVANDQAGLKGKSSGIKLSNLASASHTHVEADITNLGSYANSSHTHTVSDITDASTELAAKSHTHTTSDITGLNSYAASSHTHSKSDITDVSDLALAIDLTNHTTNTSNPHSVTYTQVGAAPSSHTHTLNNITDVTATSTEVNYLTNSTKNIQMQLNDARMYGFFPAWEYEHEYDVGDCVKTQFCKTTQYLECIVSGITGDLVEYAHIQYVLIEGELTPIYSYPQLSDKEELNNGECYIDGTCVWLVQDLRDERSIGSINLNVWRYRYYNSSNIWYGLNLYDSTIFYSCNSDKKNKMNTSIYLKYARLIKVIISSAIMSIDMSALLRLFDLTNVVDTGSVKYLRHIAGATMILDWCFRPFTYLNSENLNNIDDNVFDKILLTNNSLLLNDYNSAFGTNLTKNQIITEACAIKNRLYNNQIADDKLFFKNNSVGNRYIRQGAYGEFLDAGLPEITGAWPYTRASQDSTTNPAQDGAGYFKETKTNKMSVANATNKGWGELMFKASRANSIYGNSTTVQPATLLVQYNMKY